MVAPRGATEAPKKLRKKKPRNKPILEPEARDSLQDSKLIRALGSPDRSTREKGLSLLTSWLESHEHVSEHDMQRLWKGLYFCFWHSDLISVQTALAERLAQLVVDLSPRVALSYFQGFVQTMKREWAGIDQHRMNKYLVLVRKVYSASLMRLERLKWDPEVVEQFCSVLRDDLLLMPTANDLGAGFAYFVCDIAVEEMVKVGEAAGPGKKQLKGETVVALLQPFVEGLVATKNKLLLLRLYSGVFSEVARNVDGQIKPFDMVDGAGLADDLFARGSNKDIRATNRKYIYQASSELELAGKKHTKAEQVAPAQTKRSKQDTKKSKKTPEILGDTSEKKTEKTSKKRVAEAFGSPLDVAGPSAGEDPPASAGSSKKKKKKKKKHSSVNDDNIPDSAARATTANQGAPVVPNVPPRRKSVRINLRKNLIRTIGETPYPENVRTPPTSKPRGSALKKGSKRSAKRSLKM